MKARLLAALRHHAPTLLLVLMFVVLVVLPMVAGQSPIPDCLTCSGGAP